MITTPTRRTFSLATVVAQLQAHGAVRGTYEAEVLQDHAARAGLPFDATAPVVPFATLAQRDLTSAGTAGSGYLVPTAVGGARDAMRPWSVVIQSGATVLDGLTANLTIPRVATSMAGTWIANEASTATEEQPTLGQVTLSPKTIGAYIEISRLMSLQSPQVEDLLRSHLLTVVGRAIDAAAIAGTGGAGQPQGIVGTPGIGTQSGTTLADSGLREMARLVEAAGTAPTGWIAGPGAAKTLRGRERAVGSGMNWDAGQILGLPAVASASCTTDTLVLADWRQMVVAFWGAGIEISANPYQGFTSGITSLRVMASVDFGLAHPGAFCASTSVT